MTAERLAEIRRTVLSGASMPSAMGAELLAELDRVAEHVTALAEHLDALRSLTDREPPMMFLGEPVISPPPERP